MKITLVMATYGRYEEIELFFQSLLIQTYTNYNLIIVDQNEKISLEPLIDKYREKIDVKLVRSEKGLSRSRNVGLQYVTGEIVAFPDDDCIYQANTLQKVVDNFKKEPNANGVIGRSVDAFHNSVSDEDSKIAELKQLNKYSIWFHGISYTIFLKSEVIRDVGHFDEKLGVGSGTKYGSGEETDYLIRAIGENHSLYYDKTLEIFHPPFIFHDKQTQKKAYDYSIGRMYVLRKHQYNYGFIFLNKLYPMVKIVLNLHKPKMWGYLWSQFLGRIADDK